MIRSNMISMRENWMPRRLYIYYYTAYININSVQLLVKSVHALQITWKSTFPTRSSSLIGSSIISTSKEPFQPPLLTMTLPLIVVCVTAKTQLFMFTSRSATNESHELRQVDFLCLYKGTHICIDANQYLPHCFVC